MWASFKSIFLHLQLFTNTCVFWRNDFEYFRPHRLGWREQGSTECLFAGSRLKVALWSNFHLGQLLATTCFVIPKSACLWPKGSLGAKFYLMSFTSCCALSLIKHFIQFPSVRCSSVTLQSSGRLRQMRLQVNHHGLRDISFLKRTTQRGSIDLILFLNLWELIINKVSTFCTTNSKVLVLFVRFVLIRSEFYFLF